MTLNKTAKTAVGIGTLWILCYPLLFIGFMIITMAMPFGMMEGDSFGSPFPFDFFGIIFPLHCLTAIVQIGLMGFYLAHIIKNTEASEAIRIILGIGIFMMPYLAMPAYFYLFIWREIPPEWALNKKPEPQDDWDDREDWEEETAVSLLTDDFPPLPPKETILTPEEKSSKKKTTFIIITVIVLLCIIIAALGAFIVNRMMNAMDDWTTEYFPPESVPARLYQSSENITLLWEYETEIDDPHHVYNKFFTPNDKNVVYWDSFAEKLIARNLQTGEKMWETNTPAQSDMRLYDGKFYVLSYRWFDELPMAPHYNNERFPDCSFGGQSSLIVYDAHTGTQLWGYVYNGVDTYDVSITDESIYLTGSGDHGASRSLAQIARDSGELQFLDCYKWPQDEEKDLPIIPSDESGRSNPLVILDDEQMLNWYDVDLFLEPNGTQLDFIDGKTKLVIGSVTFDGADLSKWNMDATVKNDIAIVYLTDSDQLFGFRLPSGN